MAAHRIEDYALIGNCRTGALVSLQGSIDWLCLPRFDSPACFAALLGDPRNGRWLIQPSGAFHSTRRYRDHSLVLETEFTTRSGKALLTDAMLVEGSEPTLIRTVRGLSGQVEMRMEYVVRFDYGRLIPWMRKLPGGGVDAVAGPDHLRLRTSIPLEAREFSHAAAFTLQEGEERHLTLTWTPSFQSDSRDIAYPEDAIERTLEFWKDWAAKCTYHGPWREQVLRSLLTLKALTYEPTGGIVAALTTSLPESIGGVRNWDYRYCWLRDATFTLYALLASGYRKEAEAWREWLVRAVAGVPSQFAIVYGVRGEQRLNERELPWLRGYEGSRPVRLGNEAHSQLQLDVFGEVMDALHLGRKNKLKTYPESWNLQIKLLDYLEGKWNEPDSGIWESRGPTQHLVHSKVMAWVAIDRGIKGIEDFGRSGPIDKWREIRARIHDEICTRGFDPQKNSFVQAYGAHALDASLLLMPMVGFLPATDPRMVGTVKAIERELVEHGLVLRYRMDQTHDGLPGREGAFLACTFWLADCLMLQGRAAEARAYFERVLGISNDVGLLAEEYDVTLKRQLGNYPQALSHIALINTARNLAHAHGPAEDRAKTRAA